MESSEVRMDKVTNRKRRRTDEGGEEGRRREKEGRRVDEVLGMKRKTAYYIMR